MKKKSIILIIILTILMNIFSFIHINKNLVKNLLFDKTVVTFHFKENIVVDEKFFEEIINFSKNKKVEIAQYSFFSNNKIDIYSTMKNEYNKVIFIPNLLLNNDLKVHDFDEIFNIGFKNILYINTKDQEIIKQFSNKFSEYGKVYENLDSSYNKSPFSLENIEKYVDVDFLFVLTLFIFAFVLVTLFHYLNNKKKYLIYYLWGYSNIKIYCILNKNLYKALIKTTILCNLFMIVAIFLCNLINVLYEFIFISIILNLSIILLLFLFSTILFLLSFVNLNTGNEKGRLSKISFISRLSKFFILLLIIVLFKGLSNELITLKKSEESLSSWKNTANLYNICDTYSPIYEDLALEDEHNDKILKVYQDLSDLGKVFIIDTLNYERTPTLIKDDESLDYNYKINVKNNKDLYSPYGQNILVDKNYLKRNLVRTYTDQRDVLEEIDYDKDTLNILVPQKFKQYENIIKDSFKEWFYFQKVYIFNMYKEIRGKKLSEKKMEDLKINLIYIQNNQSYFTYNPFSGDSSNNIKDPIVTVYTENMDNSVLAATLGRSIFLESENPYTALKEVKNITQKYNINELNSILSIYDKKGEQINDIKDIRDRLILNIVFLSFILVMLTLVITYVYYKSNISKIIIKSLHGCDFINTYKGLILSNLGIYIVAFFFASIIYKEISIFLSIVISLMLIIDCIATNIVNKILIKKGEIKLIKGELK